MQILVATGNRHKLSEIRAIFRVDGCELVGLDAFPGAPDVEEDGASFQENAVKKARTLALFTGLWALADDSGLEVDALGGAPGVRSARYAGEPVDFAANNVKLLRELEGVGDRRARFRCAMALSSPRGDCEVVEAGCEGRITAALRGAHGFGYDPLFVPDGYEQTFAELLPAVKNRISHRAAALALAAETWGGRLARQARAGAGG
jgi:XTP/dITP diphosphohydrolase